MLTRVSCVPSMESVKQDASSLAKPLIQNGDVESNNHHLFTTGGTTSFFKTCFNGLNALSGVGILSIPYAIASGGWLSLVFFFIIAITALYTALLIERCMVLDSNIKSYPDIGERAFGKLGRNVLLCAMCIELYLVVTGFLILEGDNLHNLFPGVEINVLGLSIGGRQCFIIMVALVILPSVLIENLSIISYISVSGVLASVIILAAIFWTAAFDGITFERETKIVNWSGIPTAVSLYAFCYCTHPVFPTLYSSMKNKHQFSNVLIVCFLFCTITYASMAIMGYIMFGSDVQSQVTLNLPISKLSSRIAIYTTLINPISKYALMVTPIVDAAQTWLSCDHHKHRAYSILIRTALVTSTVIVALAVPFFGFLMSLVGALLSVTASVILPCLCYMKISGAYRKLSWETVIIGVILIIGVCITITGTYTSVVEIANLW